MRSSIIFKPGAIVLSVTLFASSVLGQTGISYWNAPAQVAGPVYSTPYVTTGVAYVGTADPEGCFYKLDTNTGTQINQVKTGAPIYSDPVADSNGDLFVGSDSKAVAF